MKGGGRKGGFLLPAAAAANLPPGIQVVAVGKMSLHPPFSANLPVWRASPLLGPFPCSPPERGEEAGRPWWVRRGLSWLPPGQNKWLHQRWSPNELRKAVAGARSPLRLPAGAPPRVAAWLGKPPPQPCPVQTPRDPPQPGAEGPGEGWGGERHRLLRWLSCGAPPTPSTGACSLSLSLPPFSLSLSPSLGVFPDKSRLKPSLPPAGFLLPFVPPKPSCGRLQGAGRSG